MQDRSANTTRRYTSKQMGDACEMLVAAELTLAGIPALKAPDNWPHYDVIAQPIDGPPQRISVKSRTYKTGSNWVDYITTRGDFDWLAAVILAVPPNGGRAFYIIPRTVFDEAARLDAPRNQRYVRIDRMERIFTRWRDNFDLNANPPEAPDQP